MKEFVSKFRSIEKKITKEFGDIVLFGLFLPDNTSNKWDLIISSSWLKSYDIKALKAISKILNNELNDEIIKLSRIVVIEPLDNFVKKINSAVNIKNGDIELINCEFNGIQIKHAFIITSQKANNSKKEKVNA